MRKLNRVYAISPEAEFLKYFSDKYYQNKWNSNRNDSYQAREPGDYSDVVVPSERYRTGEGNHRGSIEEPPIKTASKPSDKIDKKYQFIKNKDGIVLQIITNQQTNDKEIIHLNLMFCLKMLCFKTQWLCLKRMKIPILFTIISNIKRRKNNADFRK